MGLCFRFRAGYRHLRRTFISFSSLFSVTHAGFYFCRLRHLHIPRCSDP
jgi:hypothetical protein